MYSSVIALQLSKYIFPIKLPQTKEVPKQILESFAAMGVFSGYKET